MSVEKIKNSIHRHGLHGLLPIAMMITGVSMFSFSDVLFKLLGSDLNSFTIAFWNDLFALIVLLVLSKKLGGLKSTIRSPYRNVHIIRSCGFSFTFLCLLTAYPHMPLANVYAILFLWPLAATALALFVLKEKTHGYHWVSLILGLIGIIIILKPGPDGFNPYSFFAIAGAISISIAMVVSRKIPSSEPPFSHAFYPICTTLLISSLFMIFNAEMPSVKQLSHLAVTGTMGVFAVMLIGMAFARGNTALLSPFEYTKMFWAVTLGYIVFGDVLAPANTMGIALIISSGIYLLISEGKKKRK